jgi:hypothetical protein
MPTRNGASGANSLRTDLSQPIRSDKAALRLAVKEAGLSTSGKSLNDMTVEQLQSVVRDRIANNWNSGIAQDKDGKTLKRADILKRLLPEAVEDHKAEAEAYAKESGRSQLEAYDIVTGYSKSETGYMNIGNQRFSFQYRVESFVTDDNDEERSDKIYADSSVRIDYKTIRQA